MPAGEQPFVHLRVHTTYSLSEGAIRIKPLAKLCHDLAMPAVAITDTNNLFGGLEFSVALTQAGIQPIIGCQMNIARASDLVRGAGGRSAGDAAADTVVLLVQTAEGYGNLLRLLAASNAAVASIGQPRATLATIKQHNAGLILLTGGPAGPIGRLLLENKHEAAEQMLSDLAEAYAGRTYVEIMRHGLEQEAAIETGFLELADRLQLPIVATNEAFFATPDMYEAHDALLCIADGTSVAESNRRRVTPEHYFKSAAEMRALFSDLPDALANTGGIARRCAFVLEPTKPMLPAYDSRPGASEAESLRRGATTGLEHRLATQVLARPMAADVQAEIKARYCERLDFELDVIGKMGFSGYFLIVAEFIRWAKEQGIPVGPGRGSGAGSVVAWALTITDLDPLRFGLLFERFLNPERISMPDFDIDFCQDRRDEVIQHVIEKYGADRVAQIITFGKLQARAVLRDVGRVLGMAYGYVDKICKLVPFNPAHPVTLDEAIKAEPQLQALIEQDEAVARLISIARPLEGLYRHASTHAAGVVIADRPLTELIPIYRDPRSDVPVTGFSMKWVEEAGLVKFDFLGLKTLTILVKAAEMVRASKRVRIDLSALPLDDRGTYEMLGHGDTVGVFQLESAGMRDVLRKLRPDTFEDIIAVVALYRPGPMDNIPSYIRRKHGEELPDYLDPSLHGILRETYGIIIYQEQVMQIAQTLAGYSLGSADLLRRAMGKKIQEEMDKQREAFVSGARARGVGQSKAVHIFELVAKFAGYGFNKSHAAAYAYVAYQTAYLKANHPVEFFAASMTYDMGNIDKLNLYRQELDRLGIRLLAPDINRSGVDFTVETIAVGSEEKPGIRYALAALKNVGHAAMAAVVDERSSGGPFRSIDDFARRVEARHINRRQLENLVRAGCFDSLNANRRQLFDGVEIILRTAGASSEERASGQMGLFAADVAAGRHVLSLPDVADWPVMERLKEELDAIGFYLSAHPLDTYRSKLERLGVVPFADITAKRRTGRVALAGTVLAKSERTSGKGNRYAFVQLSDTSGVFEVVVFSELLAVSRDLLEPGIAVLVRATAAVEDDVARCTAVAVERLDAAVGALDTDVEIFIDSPQVLQPLHAAITASPPGRARIKVVVWLDMHTEVSVDLLQRCQPDAALIARLRQLPGVRDVRCD
jgi:DNA polymerase-3 subunit alpha